MGELDSSNFLEILEKRNYTPKWNRENKHPIESFIDKNIDTRKCVNANVLKLKSEPKKLPEDEQTICIKAQEKEILDFWVRRHESKSRDPYSVRELVVYKVDESHKVDEPYEVNINQFSLKNTNSSFIITDPGLSYDEGTITIPENHYHCFYFSIVNSEEGLTAKYTLESIRYEEGICFYFDLDEDSKEKIEAASAEEEIKKGDFLLKYKKLFIRINRNSERDGVLMVRNIEPHVIIGSLKNQTNETIERLITSLVENGKAEEKGFKIKLFQGEEINKFIRKNKSKILTEFCRGNIREEWLLNDLKKDDVTYCLTDDDSFFTIFHKVTIIPNVKHSIYIDLLCVKNRNPKQIISPMVQNCIITFMKKKHHNEINFDSNIYISSVLADEKTYKAWFRDGYRILLKHVPNINDEYVREPFEELFKEIRRQKRRRQNRSENLIRSLLSFI